MITIRPYHAADREGVRALAFETGFIWRARGLVLARRAQLRRENLLPSARGRGAGRRLMEAWLCQLRALGSPGCHLGTLAENRDAIAFFERMGFARHGPPVLAPGMRMRTGERMHLQLMVLTLN